MSEKNQFSYARVDGEDCVVFVTNGKNKADVIVDKGIWLEYLQNFSWTAILKGKYTTTKASVNGLSMPIWRVIVEYKYDELEYFLKSIDHKNHNPLDNRLSNLKICHQIENMTNVSSKYTKADMQYIHKQHSTLKRKRIHSGYKVHFNISGNLHFRNFSFKELGENALSEAREYRNTEVKKIREEEMVKLSKKCRDVEFKRGLRDKLQANELSEVISVLNEYGIEVTNK